MAISGSGKSPLSSQIIGGRFRVECCIASGVDANVVGAVDCATGKRVALKCWDGPTSEQEVAAIQCFVRSANVSGLFDNPHVVEVFGTELGDTVSYSVSEWLEGSTLAREVQRVGRLPVQDALHHLLPCMRAVAEAHAAGIVHGDIRPAHIFLCRAKRHVPERARVFDFGRGLPGFHELRLPARPTVDELCRYTPPELLSSGTLDARSDIYCFGLLLYEVTTGERIFVADDLRDLLREIESGPKRAISDVTQALPRGFVEVLYRAMAVDPDQRYQDLTSFLDGLMPFYRRSVQPTDEPLRPSSRPYPSRGPWVSTPSPDLPKPPRKPPPPALVTLSRIAAAWDAPRPRSRRNSELDDRIIIPRRKPLWQAAAVAAFFGVSYLALDHGVRGGTPDASNATNVTSHSAALDTQHVEVEPPAPVDNAANTFDPLPVPTPSLRQPDEPMRLTSVTSVASTAPTSRRARRAERRRAAAAARAAEASKHATEEPVELEAKVRPVELRRGIVTPIIDETIPTPPLERMELQ